MQRTRDSLTGGRTTVVEGELVHCGVMVTGYNQGDWERLLAGGL